jgi:hypothetical protein
MNENKVVITGINELHAEKLRLRLSEREQRIALKSRVNGPSAIFASGRAFFTTKANSHDDILSLVSRFVLPFTLNGTLFRHSGILIKALVGLALQKVSCYITTGTAESLFTKAKSLLRGWFHHSKNSNFLSNIN